MTVAPLRPGSRLGGYVLVRPLGRGGMGTVYEALDEGLGRRVALKVVSRELRLDRRALERFKREARASAALVHPNITAVHAIGEDHETIFVVLELLERGTLQDRLSKEGPLPWQEAAGLAAGVARGLAAIHAIGLVHRDVKPSNILLDDEGRPKLSDFGLVALPGVTQLTRTGEFVGTPQFMAPEQMGAHGETDARSDLYALGATLYALLAGRPPLEGQGAEILMKLARERPRSVRELVPEIPESLDRIVLRLLEKRKEGRGTALEVASELEAIARGDTTRMREAAAGGRPGLVLALVGSAAVVAVAAAVVAATGSSVGRKSDSDPGPARRTVASKGSRATDARPVETSTPAPVIAPAFPGCCDGFLLSRDGGYRLAQVLGSYDGRHNDVVLSVSISPDGTRALSGGRVEPFRGVADPPILWDLATGKELMALRDLAKRDVAASVWFEDATRVLVAYGAQLLILDTRTGKVRDTLKGHRKPVRSLALSADGHVALSGSEDSTIRVWDLDTGKCLREVTNHRESVVAVAFAPDGASALSASQDGELRRWKLATGEVTG